MPDSLYLVLVLFALAILAGIWSYERWERWDDYRRLERLVHRNLRKMSGQ